MRCPSAGDPGPHRKTKTRETHRCLSPFLTEEEVPENGSPSCPNKAFPQRAGKGAPNPQPLLLHLGSLRCWDAMLGVHYSEPQEASALRLKGSQLSSACISILSQELGLGVGTVALLTHGHFKETAHHHLLISG